jgi:F-type H+-transporting ATPase subunit b
MVLLRVDPGLVLWLWITFGLVILILRFTAWDRIVGALDKRSERISSDLESARQAKEKGVVTLAEYDKTIKEGRLEAAHIIEQGRAEASRLKEEMLKNTQEEIRALRAQATEEIRRASEEAELALKNQIVSLSFSIADAILRRETGRPDNRAFVEEFASKLTAGSKG